MTSAVVQSLLQFAPLFAARCRRITSRLKNDVWFAAGSITFGDCTLTRVAADHLCDTRLNLRLVRELHCAL